MINYFKIFGNRFHYFFPENHTCIQQCPDGYYGNTNNWKCDKCNDICPTCTGSTTTKCKSCVDK